MSIIPFLLLWQQQEEENRIRRRREGEKAKNHSEKNPGLWQVSEIIVGRELFYRIYRLINAIGNDEPNNREYHYKLFREKKRCSDFC